MLGSGSLSDASCPVLETCVWSRHALFPRVINLDASLSMSVFSNAALRYEESEGCRLGGDGLVMMRFRDLEEG